MSINQEYVKYIIILICISIIGYLTYLLYKDIISIKDEISVIKNIQQKQTESEQDYEEEFNNSEESEGSDDEENDFDPESIFNINTILNDIEEEEISSIKECEELSDEDIIEEVNTNNLDKCKNILKSGKNKGNLCGRDILNDTNYCKLHSNNLE